MNKPQAEFWLPLVQAAHMPKGLLAVPQSSQGKGCQLKCTLSRKSAGNQKINVDLLIPLQRRDCGPAFILGVLLINIVTKSCDKGTPNYGS